MFYIMSYNTINGYCSGVFQDIDSLFYGADQSNPESIKWVPLLAEAQGFATAKEAEAVIDSKWGYPSISLGVLFVPDDVITAMNDEMARSKLNTRADTGRRLATRTINKDELLEMSKDIWKTNALTYREKWIIDILTKEY